MKLLNCCPKSYIMKSSFVFSISLLTTVALYAQDPVYDKEGPARQKTISLKTYKFDGTAAAQVASIEILPVQWDTARIGFAQVGIGNRKIDAVPALPYRVYLQEYIDRQYQGQLKGSAHLLWAVKDVRINERSFNVNERGFARIKADAYISADGRLYKKIMAFDTVMIRNGMDVTSRHDENIARAIQELLNASVLRGLPLLDDASVTAATKDAIIKEQMDALALPIVKNKYVDGVYRTYEEFKQNNPSVRLFDIEKEKRSLLIYQKDEALNKQLIEKPWGLCRNGELYKIEGKDMIPLELSGNGFVLSGYLQEAVRRNNAILLSSLMGGMAGYAIAGASTRLLLVRTIPYITSQQPEATAIDMETGELTL